MPVRPRLLVAAAGLALACAVPAHAELPSADGTLTLDGLPRPATPPPEAGPVVPAQVVGWRNEAKAYEYGDGVPADPVRAAELYCRASRYGDAESQYSLAWMMTNSRGIERDEAAAAHLFAAAAEQGMPQAQNMLRHMGTPVGPPPACLRQPDEDRVSAAAAAPAGPRPVPGRQSLWPAAIPANAPPSIVRYVQLVAPEYKLDPQLVLTFMQVESNFNAWAVSPKNAQGLMQVLPETAARFGVHDVKDPVQNIRAGMAYLRWLMAYFQGDISLVAAAYNAGEKAVEKYLGVPPYAETRLYVLRIRAGLGGRREAPYDPSVTPPSQLLALLRPLKLSQR
ncbi:MAG: transglycosylase SLT domain-containing protein [Burkholderiales bacterium]|nr:transglycosylase SLT domain-containing protein [Burkholderiales bacterium]MDE1927527.1 transglycosylase SLT domain-containing protein [Burkholderiales bacterium]MDE2157537.1 transglycosylase SLT domain-containing protein [Burkholderiales bacterium]MDE2503976.1 transglycosylase SLT domain-containing protein [Burkholderiales bacterium]